MAKYNDLTHYGYYGYNPKIFNIGWLQGDFPKGETSEEFKTKLEVYLQYPQQQMQYAGYPSYLQKIASQSYKVRGGLSCQINDNGS